MSRVPKAARELIKSKGVGISVSLEDLRQCGWDIVDNPRKVPPYTGIYAIYSSQEPDSECLYVGQSVDLRQRLNNHERWQTAIVNCLAPCIAFEVVYKNLNQYECLMIGLLSPIWNAKTPCQDGEVTNATLVLVKEVREEFLEASARLAQTARAKNRDCRQREYLRPDEVEHVLTAAKQSSAPLRNQCLVLTSYRHGLRVGEAVDLRWTQIDFESSQLHVKRLKNGTAVVHPIEADELKLLKKLKRETGTLPWVFVSRLRAAMTTRAANMIVTELGQAAKLEFPIHFHMLRHSCGFYLASRGYDTRLIQDWLGHKNIQHTVRYTALTPSRFEGLWR
jgi:hypothetical protein